MAPAGEERHFRRRRLYRGLSPDQLRFWQTCTVIVGIGMLIIISIWVIPTFPWFDKMRWEKRTVFTLEYEPETDLWRVVIPSED